MTPMLEHYQRILEQRAELHAQRLAEIARDEILAQRDPQRSLPSALADSVVVNGGSVRVTAPHAAFIEFTRWPYLRPAIEQLRKELA
jgi:hypothetical protein